MSNQLYTYQYRRPRFNNPTFLSNSVASTLSFYNPKKIGLNQSLNQSLNQIQQKEPGRYDGGQNNDKNPIRSSQSDYSLPKINKKYLNPNGVMGMRQDSKLRSNSSNSNLQKYGKNILQNSSLATKDLLRNHNDTALAAQISKNSSLINLNQRDIYIKQGHNYNIITYQPKHYNDCIKMYPKLSLQQKDQYFRMRYINDDKFKKSLNGGNDNNPKINNPQKESSRNSKQGNKINIYSQDKMAGMPTYRVSDGNENQTVNKQSHLKPSAHVPFTPAQVSDQKMKDNPRRKNFDMKMLNHMDELNYYS